MVKRVYIAGPYSSAPEANTARAIESANVVFDMGYYPYLPHLSHFWNLLCPRPYEDWLRLDLEWLKYCDYLVRLPGESAGADRECAAARKQCIPIFLGLDAFVAMHEQARRDVE